MSDHVLSVDLGGTNMRVAVVDRDGELLLRRIEPTPRHEPTPVALERLLDTVRDEGGGRGSYGSVVVGVPGRVDYVGGQLEHAPNLPASWVTELNERSLSEHFDVPVRLANDADLAAVGEAYFGAGQPFCDIAYVTISTGIGAGVVLAGKLLHGTRSLAEVGHTIVAIDRLADHRPATAEELGAGPALAHLAEREGVCAVGPEIVALVQAGHQGARRAWDQLTEVVSSVVVNMAHQFSPDTVVVGGGVGRNGVLLLDPLRAALDLHGPRQLPQPIQVVQATLGDASALVGAAAWDQAFG